MTGLNNNHYVVNNGTFLPQRGIEVAEWLPKYSPNLTLSWIPPENRDVDDIRHFAIYDSNVQDIIVRFREDQLNVDLIQRWLDDNDGSKHDLMKRFEDEQAKAAKIKKDIADAEMEVKLDFVHALANSKNHTFKHNGVKFGQEKPDLKKALSGMGSEG